MLSRVWSAVTIGVDALPVEVETHIEPNLPRWTVVGLPDGAVRESRDRVVAALKSSGLPPPRGAVTVNLAPADVRKEGSAFDLPIALGLLAAAGHVPQERLDGAVVLGELSLDGSLRPVRGVLPVAIGARAEGRRTVVVPRENAAEASVVEGVEVFAVGTLTEAFELLAEGRGEPYRRNGALFNPPTEEAPDWSDVRGQEGVKRALEVAAAGGHNALLVGPPGAGKTMLARRLPGILPPLTPDEALETTKIHSVGGKLDGAARHGLVTQRPFRSPHHTISDAGLCGGGTHPMPGEISLAHHGVLFLDELPEFRRQVLEVLRQPLEEGRITIARARQTVVYPAQFMLLASMNPCPCGHLNDPTRACVCAPPQVQRYLAKLSGPLLDRIDLHVEVTPVPYAELSRREPGESSATVRQRVIAARERQAERFRRLPGVHANAQMPPRLVRKHAALDAVGEGLLRQAIERLGLSGRAYDRILKVARTVADLAGCERVAAEHVAEAVQYRSLDRSWWGG
jgi:magnesium chelatase family protein